MPSRESGAPRSRTPRCMPLRRSTHRPRVQPDPRGGAARGTTRGPRARTSALGNRRSQFCARGARGAPRPGSGGRWMCGRDGVRSIAWWEGDVVCGSVRQRYEEYHGGEIDSYRWTHRQAPPAEVEAVDGQLLVLSPWVVRNVRFDETLLLGHGFDLDYSLQVRQAGRKLLVAELGVLHPPLARARQRPRSVDRGPHPGRGKVGWGSD